MNRWARRSRLARSKVSSSRSSSDSRPTSGALRLRGGSASSTCPSDAPGLHRLEAAQLERPDGLRLDAARGEAKHGRADQDVARLGRLLQPRREVHRLAGRERRVARLGDDLAGLDADPRLEPEVVDGAQDRERSAHRPLRVVLVRLRDPEGGHHRVPGELLDDPAVRAHAVLDLVEEAVDPEPHDLRIGACDLGRRVDEVHEDHGCELPLHPFHCIRRGRPYADPDRDRPSSISPVLDPKVFKAYDVRGLYPSELDEEGAYAIGRAYVEQFEPRRIAVGRDMRVSAPSMAKAVIEGAAAAGADVLDLGMIGTEMLYFAVGELGLDGGIEVTASHNPKQYIGMKIVRRGALPVGGESGLLDVRDRAVSGGQAPGPGSPGHVEPYDIWPAFLERVLSFVDLAALQPLQGRDRRRERDGRRDARRPCSSGCRSRPCAATSSRTAPSRTTSRTRSSPRTASSSSG